MVPSSATFRVVALVDIVAGCNGRSSAVPTTVRGSTLTRTALTGAVAVAMQRMTAHGQSGLSVEDVKRTREWFTPELYALLVRDMSDPGGIGYLNWDPFTAEQDDIGPFRRDTVSQAGDTVMVSFSRDGNVRVRLGMRYENGAWCIANFFYPDNSPCHRDLARGLARYAGTIAAKLPLDSGGCSN